MQVDACSEATVPPMPGQATQGLLEVINLKLRPEQPSTCSVPNGASTAETTSLLRMEPLRDPLSELPLNQLPLDIAKEAENESSSVPIFSPLRDEHFGFGIAAEGSGAEVEQGQVEIYPETPLENGFNTQSQDKAFRKVSQAFSTSSEKLSESASEEKSGGAKDAPAISTTAHGPAGSANNEPKLLEASATSSLVRRTSSSSVEVSPIRLSVKTDKFQKCATSVCAPVCSSPFKSGALVQTFT